ncbi:putative MFS transporter, AGZA family, xanthine/uracil permease [Carnobacterium alterfunditum]|uniref:Putative MFS transporter, AGZA family, xanthine/uracil permease n=1 Tax=Carnobacterium alterfunditum TaxID=28230 RepID=A0A1N6HWR7_9LACT|nr:NCS2 family permease [Carnobacterium alterfunditum]SIO24065.1 putative MFS transporter, AGZA family, xanthine/uracil permease [Carnobacterium alterfunditum]
MEKFFKLKENGTTVNTEIMAGLTTFFAMSYIIFVNPAILSLTGMPTQAVFLSTIIAAVIGTLVMGLFANVPYAQAPGMGLNAFFTYTVVFALGFSWQEALAMVFICGIVNILITVTKVRKLIIHSIPESLQHAISAGIGVFVAYIGIKNAGFLQFTSEPGNIETINNTPFDAAGSYSEGISSIVTGGGIVPALVNFTNPGSLLALIGLIITMILLVKNVKGAILIGIILTTIIGIPMGVVDVSVVSNPANSLGNAFSELGTTFGAAFGNEGMISLFTDAARLPLVIMTIFAFSLSDIFDTIGTFIGTGRKTGIFTAEDELALDNSTGFKTKMDKALFADAIATSAGALFGTSNTTTYVESAAGIAAGGRTGLTSVVVAVLFLLTSLFSPLVALVPTQATSASLILVGVMMMSSFLEINWDNLEEAIPAFFASIFMGLSYSISYGIAAGFIFYVIVKVAKGKAKDIHPVLWVSTGLFVLNFLIMAFI